jgi:DNA-binding MltR family transcriptional regulator
MSGETKRDRKTAARLDLGNDGEFVSRFAELKEILDGESDRGCALVATSFLDEALRAMLKRFLVADPSVEALLDRTLQSADAKGKLAFALGLIAREELNDFDQVRSLRNEFAHLHTSIKFTDDFVVKVCEAFESSKWLESLLDGSTARGRFVMVAASLASSWWVRAREIDHRPVAPAFGLAETVATVWKLPPGTLRQT